MVKCRWALAYALAGLMVVLAVCGSVRSNNTFGAILEDHRIKMYGDER